MNHQLGTWQLIDTSLRQNIPVMLLYVVESNGSSPGRSGFCMAVTAAGTTAGSIGGGIMEHKLVELAKQSLAHPATVSIRKQVHDKQAAANRSGMICSGDQTIVLYPVQPAALLSIQNILSCIAGNRNGCLELSPSGLLFTPDVITENRYTYHSQTAWTYREQLGYIQHLFIVGAGHCALALSRIMCLLDFYIHLYDDRPGLQTFQQNSFAHEKTIIPDYQKLSAIIPPGNEHYVVIMTAGYRTDDMAVRALMQHKFRYLGLLGSRKKIEQLFDNYRKAGVPDKTLNRMHAPIGMPVKSQTPEEIAISIAAEIIQVKNQDL